MFSFESKGSWQRTQDFLNHLKNIEVFRVLNSCGQEGVAALAAATPVDSGRAAGSWGYKTSGGHGRYTITWTNSDIEGGFPVAVMLQYGHGTGNGGYVAGQDYINPAIKPIFDKIAERVWREVKSA